MKLRSFFVYTLAGALLLAGCGGEQPPAVSTPTNEGAEPNTTVVAPAETATTADELSSADAIKASDLIGYHVTTPAGDDVGTVDDAFVALESGEVEYLVIADSGMANFGDNLYLPVPRANLTLDGANDRLVLDRDVSTLASAFGFNDDAWPDVSVSGWDADILVFWANSNAGVPMPTPVGTTEPSTGVMTDTGVMTGTDIVTGTDMTTGTDMMTDTEPMTGTDMMTGTDVGTMTNTETMTGTGAMTDTAPMTTPETMTDTESMTSPEMMTDTEMMTGTPTVETPLPEVTPMATGQDGNMNVEVPKVARLSTLKDLDIVNDAGESLGSIEDMVISWQDGSVKYVVLSFGGFLGMGDKWFAVPWGALTLDLLNQSYVLNTSPDVLAEAPGFDKDNWPDISDPNWNAEITQFWTP